MQTLAVSFDGFLFDVSVLLDKKHLCICPAWQPSMNRAVPGLYIIYFKRFAMKIGPYYAELLSAERDLNKLMKEFPQDQFWEQKLEWYQNQGKLHDWVDKNLGRPEYLIGGIWIKD